MRKIKYQGAITKVLCQKKANKHRNIFKNMMFNNFDPVINSISAFSQKRNHFDVVSFSSKRDFEEQVLSIVSYLRYVGTPLSWIIYSDGSHDNRETDFLNKYFKFVKIEKIDLDNAIPPIQASLEPYGEILLDYATKFPLGKKLFYYLNHPLKNKTVFLDSDILFYSDAANYFECIDLAGYNYFLPEGEWGTLDKEYLEKYDKKCMYQVNSGFFVLTPGVKLDLSKGMEYLLSKKDNYDYFTEQTTFHSIFSKSKLYPLDPRVFYLNNKDQFDFSYSQDGLLIALRHYTGPVRHKMWQRGWKWQLQVK